MKSLSQFLIESQEKKKPTIQWMEEHYDKFNKELFDNELPKTIKLEIDNFTYDDSMGEQSFELDFYFHEAYMKDGMYQMLYRNNGTWGIFTNIEDLKPIIRLNKKYSFTELEMEDTLIHEMVHLWIGRNCLEPKRAHGKEFKAKCNEVRERAKELYNKEYNLMTRALTNGGYTNDEIENDAKKVAKRGGGVFSILFIMNDGEKRFLFCTKNKLQDIVDAIYKYNKDKISKLYINKDSFTEIYKKFGKFSTQNKYTKYWIVNDRFKDIPDMIINGGQELLSFNGIVKESLLSNIKQVIKKLMNIFVKVKRGTNISDLDLDTVLDYQDNLENEEMVGTEENDSEAIEVG